MNDMVVMANNATPRQKQSPETLVVTDDHSPASGLSSSFPGSSATGSSATASGHLQEPQREV